MARSRQGQKSAGAAASRFEAGALEERWGLLHRGDREPFPDARRVARLAKSNANVAAQIEDRGGAAAVAGRLEDAWREFHAGHFGRAIEIGGKLGAVGVAPAGKAAAIHSSSLPPESSEALKILQAAARRGEQALELLPAEANSHYMLALVLGRYSQRISVVKALADGLAGRVRGLLERTLELEPRHADAHIAFGLYHAEIVGKLGSLVAGLTYQASRREAVQHFKRAIELAPAAPIAHLEYAHGLLLIDARAHRAEAAKLYERAAACAPADAMERLDVERARQALV